jgi:hypothetical protein
LDAAENKFKTRVLLKTWSAPTKAAAALLAEDDEEKESDEDPDSY